jgi:hypothetical protein
MRTSTGKLSPEYRSWLHMRERCRTKTCKDYKNYGARGIGIDPAWDSFAQFLADMGRRPTIRHTLDRRNNNGDYSRSNCRWATRLTQGRNSRRVVLDKPTADHIRTRYAQGGVSHLQLARLYGVAEGTIWFVLNNKLWL